MDKIKLAPICLFTYNRLHETMQTIEALQANYLAIDSDLIIFSDGGKNAEAQKKVDAVRQYLKSIKGFKSIEIIESKQNKGLANSVIEGVSTVLQKYGKIIVLEDDLITSPNFLSFMNDALNFYEEKQKIFSISGYSFDLSSLKSYTKDYYFGYRASSWGWATWLDRWETIDWGAKKYKKVLYNPYKHIKFMRGGSDMPLMLWRQMNGKLDSWAIRWCLQQFLDDKLTVFPTKSKIKSVGFGVDATHTKNATHFDTIIDSGESVEFRFSNQIFFSKEILKEFRSVFSLKKRLIRTLKRLY